MSFFQEKLKVEDLLNRATNKNYFSPIILTKKLIPRVSRYNKILRFSQETRISSISPVSINHYKQLSIPTIANAHSTNTQFRALSQSPVDSLKNSSKLNTFTLLPPLRNSTELLNYTHNPPPNPTPSLRFTMYGTNFSPKSKFLPVLQEKKQKNSVKNPKTQNFNPHPEEHLHGWERTSSQSSLLH